MKVSVILPSRNEENTIGICIEKIKKVLKKDFEIIVSDSSKDRSAETAKNKGVKVVKHNLDGYGNAVLEGIKHAKGEYVIIGDADDTYDFAEIPKLLKFLDEGYDLVIGTRSRIEKGAMPLAHRYFGTPFFSFLISRFFHKKVTDINSGLRALRRDKLEKLNLRTKGMEFASEMIIKAIKKRLRIKEVPITYKKRVGESKLRTMRDGWLHLRFILLYSPNYVFLWPGLALTISGFLIMSLILSEQLVLFEIRFETHPMFIGAALVILGYQLILTGISARIYSHNHLGEKDEGLERLFSFFNLEKATAFSLILLLTGFLIYLYVLIKWISLDFGELDTINISIFALTFLVLGFQTIFTGLLFSILGIKE
jgi:glycosyltransferase involved in cell wall biosynthesis